TYTHNLHTGRWHTVPPEGPPPSPAAPTMRGHVLRSSGNAGTPANGCRSRHRLAAHPPDDYHAAASGIASACATRHQPARDVDGVAVRGQAVRQWSCGHPVGSRHTTAATGGSPAISTSTARTRHGATTGDCTGTAGCR